MPLPPDSQEEVESEDWLTTYADAITLLMAFFVMLLNFSKIDIPAFEEAAAGIKNEIGMGPKETSPIANLEIEIEDVVYNMQADQVIKVSTDDNGIVIELSSSAFYKPGSADIREAAFPVLEKIAEMLLAPKYRFYNVEVEGHTDDIPIHTDRFPSNWELSAGRASAVVRYYISKKMDPERLKATGFADTRPKLPNRDEDGNSIRENQAANRRVNIRVFPMNLPERDALLEKIDERAEAARIKKEKEKERAREKARKEAEKNAPAEESRTAPGIQQPQDTGEPPAEPEQTNLER